MSDLGKVLVAIGILLTVVGALLWSGIGRNWLGRLPGDFQFSNGRVGFYFPFTTCLIVSVILTLLFHFLRKP